MVRDLFGQRVCLRTTSASMTDMVLMAGAEAGGAKCSAIPESTPGIGYGYDSDSGRLEEIRIAKVTDADIRNDIQYGRAPAGMLAAGQVIAQPYLNYRFYTTDRQPLRTGITNNFERRYKEYRTSYEKEVAAIEGGYLDPAKALHSWFPEHDHRQTVVTEAKDKAEAKAIESQFIEMGCWRGNHQENMGASLRNIPAPVPEKLSRFGRKPRSGPDFARPASTVPQPSPAPVQPAQWQQPPVSNVTPIRSRSRQRPEPATTRRRRA